MAAAKIPAAAAEGARPLPYNELTSSLNPLHLPQPKDEPAQKQFCLGEAREALVWQIPCGSEQVPQR